VNNTLNNLTFFILGISVGISGARIWYDYMPTDEELAIEFTAYRHCLQEAGNMRCHMTPQDFVRYYELKNKLEAEK
jgi:hypothetical protein